MKNKVAPPFKEVEFDIMYGHGISREGDLLDLGSNENIVEKSGTWFSFGGERIGQGREQAKAFLREHPEVLQQVEGKLFEFGIRRGPVAVPSPPPTRWPRRRRDVPGPGADRGGRPALPLSTPERASAASANRATRRSDAPCRDGSPTSAGSSSSSTRSCSADPDQARARLPADVRVARASPVDLAPGASLLVARSLRHRGITSRCPAGGLKRAPLPRTCSSTRSARTSGSRSIAVLRGDPFVRARRRAEIAAALAAAAGEHALAIDAEPEQPGGASDRAMERATRGAAEALLARFYPPADHADALPLPRRERRGAAAPPRAVVCGYHRDGRLVAAALARHGAYAARETVLLAEALAGAPRRSRRGRRARAIRPASGR